MYAEATNRPRAHLLTLAQRRSVAGVTAFVIISVVALLHAPDQLQSQASEDVGQEPDGPEEPKLGIGKEAAEVDAKSDTGRVVVKVHVLLELAPHGPAVVLKNLVVHDCAKVEEVAES